MKNQLIVTLAAIFSLLLVMSADAEETGKKIYVSPEQIEITKDGVIAYIPGNKKPVMGKTLSFDDQGMYIKEWKGPCWIHNLWCNRCGGCGVLLCPMNCSCYD